MSDTLHIVCLDSPSPPDYGGAIDMFYKIRALKETGKRIILHYFRYNERRNTTGIAPYCDEIHSYQRKAIWQAPPLSQPFIVRSRINHELVKRLNRDDHPVLLEGLHCAGVEPFLQNKERIVVRLHNDEAAYYRHLARTSPSLFRRLYFAQESRLLLAFQKSLDKDIPLACLSTQDLLQFKNVYGFRNLSFIPCFIPWQHVRSREGKGSYCLYHGNLSVPENEKAVEWLVQEIFSKLPVPFVVAGKGISKRLSALAKKYPNISLVNNPPDDEMQALVTDAQVHVLPSLNATGVKLKLLNALFNGRFCLANANGIQGSGMEDHVQVVETAVEWISAVERLMQTEFTAADKEGRKAILSVYNNRENAEKLIAQWRHCQ
ncbi:glycosyltransferase [Flavisolibacter nicotianae]|uniref:glycosyltransferase n=1 Tax=Flavisolibacter nicotianae TaxID=2364882 RepID=UPI000EAF16D0|nr:glycosyltransferase [Flavisolibacter nicotianae]